MIKRPTTTNRDKLFRMLLDKGMSNSYLSKIAQTMRGKSQEEKENLAERIIKEIKQTKEQKILEMIDHLVNTLEREQLVALETAISFQRNKITEVLLRSVMKKGTLRISAGAFVYYNRRSRRCTWVRPAGHQSAKMGTG